MSFKSTLLLFVVILAIYQVNCSSIFRERRDTQTQDASKTIDTFINDLKVGFDDVLTKLQNNEDLQAFTNQMKQLGQEFAAKTTKLAEDTQKAFKTK